MSRARQLGWCTALGVLAVTLTGCAATVQPGGPELDFDTLHVSPPLAACPANRAVQLPDVPGSTLVPGTPVSAFGCRYEGLNDPHPNSLAQSAQITGTQLDKLVTTLNSAGPWPPGRYCPIDVGLYDLVVFTDKSGSQTDVRVAMGGCASATNGHKTVEANADLLGQLTSMVGASPPPSN
jgi:hypothetical protein